MSDARGEQSVPFSKGVSALAWLRNIHLLREVDVSRNRNVDDTVVRNLHTALVTSDSRRSPATESRTKADGCQPPAQVRLRCES